MQQGIYEQIINEKLRDALSEIEKEHYQIDKENLDVEEARKVLSMYISNVTRKALKFVRDSNSSDDALLKQIRTCNDIITVLSENVDKNEFESLKIMEDGKILTSIYSKMNKVISIVDKKPIRPSTSISQSSLFTGSNYEPNMLEELKKEILTSDSIDILVSFIRWSGLRCIIEELREFTNNKGKLRIITTSYMGATEFKAIEELSKLDNTEIRISYNIKSTRLHAKAYTFKRLTGFTTAYIGSSNISHPALTSGLEWNIKVTEKDSFDIIKKVEASFDSYWNDKEFTCFNVNNKEDNKRLIKALKSKYNKKDNDIDFRLEIKPYPYQEEMLENLQVEREVFGRNKNLLVAATGVGKTVISGFDYKRYKKKNKSNSRLLFVAHREEILSQSRDTFRAILKDFNFGDLLVGGHIPESLDYLFISIQSFNSIKLYEKTTRDYYDFIIVDEFHHAAAKSYQKLLDYYKPKILLGLTATPERMDGKDVLKYFDHAIASEMRLTEAINKKLLCPFQYFCVSDTEDLSNLRWSRGGYNIKELENVYTSSKIRCNQIVTSIYKYVSDIDDVKGLGFCVSIEHAKYMANYFNNVQISSIALHGGSSTEERKRAKDRLVSGEIKIIFVVDLYNEGIDIKEVNTILFLRPTESLTVFLQQLGRGLRLDEDKDCLTVLDFVGQAHKNYNFEEKFRALLGKTKYSIRHYIENGFHNLPKGCFIQLEKYAKQYILRNIKNTANNRHNLIAKMKYFEHDSGLELTLENFLDYYKLSIYDFYGKNGDRSFSRMKVEAELANDFQCNIEKKITRRLPSLFHINSLKLIKFINNFIKKGYVIGEEERLMRDMLYYSFYQSYPAKLGYTSIEEGLENILKYDVFREEILSIINFNYNHINAAERENSFDFPCPLGIHSYYSIAQILAAFDYYNSEANPAFREGVKYFKDKKLDCFFITLNKSEKDFSPSTLYEDYAISEKLFHWQTQSQVHTESARANRYIHHRHMGNKIALFVREYKKENGYTSPYLFLGTCNYISHSGNRPISFIWELDNNMPPMFVTRANKNVL
ncbi:MAG: DUF3427 domain-containing protein [Vallitalea sp.]|jgi:superfamily II DNA or RNA helicase|nr:DUF3427 domain-containing protein [Vallitalea sp.]